MSVITITRQYGAGGSKIAELIAQRLGWTVVDNEFVEEVARRAGLPVETVAAREERAPSLKERLVSALATASPEVFVPTGETTDEIPTEERIVQVTGRVIAELAQHGRVVLVGRGAQVVLAGTGSGDALHVYVVAPLDFRVRTVVERLGVNEKDAARAIEETDGNRDRYVERWHGRRRQDPSLYHVSVNTAWLGYDGATDVIMAAVRLRGWAQE